MKQVDARDLELLGDLIADELREWWEQEGADWDQAIKDALDTGSNADLWDSMPEVDSKAVARSSFIFEKHLGIPLDVKLIQPGGYSSIEDVIRDLIPKHLNKVMTNDEQGG